MVASGSNPRELTWRGVALGAVLTVIFTAANVYLGLRIGLTFATSIPAAVISMAILRLLPGSTIQENNIVQTIASSAGTLSAIVFVLPGLVMVGWWSGFPYWQSVAVIAIGGILGVMYSVPLRRALVTGSDLPYPEGVAAAEVLKVGAGEGGVEENRRGLAAVATGTGLSVAYPLLAKLGLVAEEASGVFRFAGGATTAGGGLSLALIGVGHLVGLAVGLAILTGVIIGFGVLLPIYTAVGAPAGTELADFVSSVFRAKIRFIGAGTIGVAAIWTLLRVIGPIVRGIAGALAASRARAADGYAGVALAERDLPIGLVGGTIVVLMLPIAALLAGFASGGPVADHLVPTLVAAVAYVLVAGVVIASVCGYMAGLIGASNSPISGVGILAALGIALVMLALFGHVADPAAGKALVAFALFVTALVFGVATISNDNLQDLKTGELVGATPWRQQVALVLGVVFGAVVIPPILTLLNGTFGFAGAPGAGPEALAAPQAALISAIIQGVLGQGLDWKLIALGAGIGAVAIAIDEGLRATRKGSLPPLAVGMGMYLPMPTTLPVVVGAVLGHFYNRWAMGQRDPALAERMGVLTATGLIVGDGLFNIAFAAIVAGSGKADVMTVVAHNAWAMPLGLALFGALIAFAYARMARGARM
ncbi:MULTISPECIES: OPT family oligopeptide transporter [unclassified Novosphingobium]|uniref:OPT family oligopeptide transporter n=1 Tax=unclassified Novosphingobium TaxID=2644732 RepID=UPI0014947BD6|nr:MULTISPECIES: oligopeptide transporter, OPT family [unclassified Novosphingobium]MBB3623116.1 putative OPT family oligopeptide transporter [Novosphingobium sp. BK592]NOX07702.1 putative OPT family oligopeptide transporter [Novosphingobium sp. SG754]